MTKKCFPETGKKGEKWSSCLSSVEDAKEAMTFQPSIFIAKIAASFRENGKIVFFDGLQFRKIHISSDDFSFLRKKIYGG